MLRKITAKFKALFVYPFQFNTFGQKSLILSPLAIDGKSNIQIGKHVIVQHCSWLAALPLVGTKAELVIGDETVIGHFNHIYAIGSVVIEEHVLTADRVYISDNLHSYQDVTQPIIQQPIEQLPAVRIGSGSWIGENVSIIGASIGKHCVIGANAVVTKDIPDYSVAVGIPAKVIKRYNFATQQWEKVKEND